MSGSVSLKNRLNEAMARLRARAEKNQEPAELAFYGGTFTKIPPDSLNECLNMASHARKEGLAAGFRCSTRPDAIDEKIIEKLIANGCSTVELGVQSFSARALRASGRNYSPAVCALAAKQITGAGIELGIQLMPGMPGSMHGDFIADVRQAIDLGARVLRFYPCLVFKGSALEKWLVQKKHIPWNLEKAINVCARAWLLAQEHGARVIRMGLAPQAGLNEAVLAGPVHPAFGDRVLGKALFALVKSALRRLNLSFSAAFSLCLPKSCQGAFWGWKGDLKDKWAKIGVFPQNVRWHDEELIVLSWILRNEREN